MGAARSWGTEKEEFVINGHRAPMWEDGEFWRWTVVTVAQQSELERIKRKGAPPHIRSSEFLSQLHTHHLEACY